MPRAASACSCAGGCTPSVRRMPSRSYAVMKPAPSSARRTIGSSVPLNAGSLVPFWKSAITTETGSCGPGGPRRCVPPDRDRAHEQDGDDRGEQRQPHHAPDRNQLALLVQPLSAASSSAVVWNRFAGSGSRHRAIKLVERLRDLRVERARRRRRVLHALPQLRDRAVAVLGALPADEQVVEDQPDAYTSAR